MRASGIMVGASTREGENFAAEGCQSAARFGTTFASLHKIHPAQQLLKVRVGVPGFEIGKVLG